MRDSNSVTSSGVAALSMYTHLHTKSYQFTVFGGSLTCFPSRKQLYERKAFTIHLWYTMDEASIRDTCKPLGCILTLPVTRPFLKQYTFTEKKLGGTLEVGNLDLRTFECPLKKVVFSKKETSLPKGIIAFPKHGEPIYIHTITSSSQCDFII